VKYRLVIFDMDGTLADSYPWFLSILSAVCDKFGLRQIGPQDIDTLRGYDSARILEWLEVPRWKLPVIVRHMRALKGRHLHEIPLFPGVDRLLGGLRERGLVLAVVSSDREDNVRQALGPSARLIHHYACGASLFGKSAKFRSVLRRAKIPAAQAITIGDETRDIDAARQAGIAFGAVAWGYASLVTLQERNPDEVFMTIEEITARLT
jgi:phosphoglycolate phosphatase